jgi:hypothetical protein
LQSDNNIIILTNISEGIMIASASVFALLASSGVMGFIPSAQRSGRSAFSLNVKKGGAGFNYDPSNYKDSNSANYRRLTDQIAAVKAEEEQMKKERDEIIRKEKMALMFLQKENATFWQTPGDTIVATNEKYFVPPEVVQIIDDLDNQLIGLQSVRFLHESEQK